MNKEAIVIIVLKIAMLYWEPLVAVKQHYFRVLLDHRH